MAGTSAWNQPTPDIAGRGTADAAASWHVRSIAFGSTECSACRVQMEDVARKRTLHPVQYLALAYGLLPEIAHRLQPMTQDVFR